MAKPLQELEAAERLLALLDCPRALTVAIMLRYGHFDDVVSLRAVPEDYLESESFFKAYQATRLLQKSEWLPTTFDKKAKALETFHSAESMNRGTNDFFRALRIGSAEIANPTMDALLRRARGKIREMLRGVRPSRFLDHCGFGPGADMSTSDGFTAVYNKLVSPGSVTRECSIFLDFYVQQCSLMTKFQWDISTRQIMADRVAGNRVAFVPKDCKTDRTIAVEPRWNVFFQKGMGQLLRLILQRNGVDLDDQSINQRLAMEGSLTGQLATLDLASASDSVSYELVAFMFPERWVSYLDRLRSPFYFLDGKWVRSEKWSSMGNGYTFELESMLFYAITWAVCGDNVSVYGDDLVVPTGNASEVIELLRICGFSTNSKKSFTAGPFRESCGGDYFNGVNVTPVYWKKPLNAEGTLRLVNQVSVLARRIARGRSRDRRYRRFWSDLVHRLPKHLSFHGPTSIASCVHDHSSKWSRRARWGWDGWEVRVGLPYSVRFPYRDYEAAVLSQWFSPSTGGYSIRDRTKWKIGTVFIPSNGFEDLPEWG